MISIIAELIHSIGATRCGAYPEILQGYYIPIPEDNAIQNNPGSKEDGYPVGTELQADCVPTYALNCSHPHRHLCGRINCQPDERWAPRDGVLITACVAKPVLLTVNGEDGNCNFLNVCMIRLVDIMQCLVNVFVDVDGYETNSDNAGSLNLILMQIMQIVRVIRMAFCMLGLFESRLQIFRRLSLVPHTIKCIYYRNKKLKLTTILSTVRSHSKIDT